MHCDVLVVFMMPKAIYYVQAGALPLS